MILIQHQQKAQRGGTAMKIISGLQCLLFAGFLVLVAGEAIPAETRPGGGLPPSIAEQVLYRFCPQVGCTDGTNPGSPLVMDGAGNLYGTTFMGGNRSSGTVFKLAPNGTGWTETVLYNFCSQGGGECTDGANPYGGSLLMDSAGNLYGTTQYGGIHTKGAVFQLAPSGNGWSESVLYSFCSQTNCADGLYPGSGLIMDGAGSLYGTTIGGGNQNEGVVYQLALSGGLWSEAVLYSFCSQAGCADGATTYTGLTMDGAGYLYGTTTAGGTHGKGTVYRLAPTSNGWAQSVLYSFCPQTGCPDGAYPDADLTMDGAGNLFGTANTGGKYNRGAAFQLTPNGSSWTQSVLYSFCAQGGSSCTDGAPRWLG
jgi:uncharacterized repeat protein (TIGR03803 family)